MLNIIAIADDDSLVGHIEPNAELDILISLGDLYDVSLQKAIDLYDPEHVMAISGNHCIDAVRRQLTCPVGVNYLDRLNDM